MAAPANNLTTAISELGNQVNQLTVKIIQLHAVADPNAAVNYGLEAINALLEEGKKAVKAAADAKDATDEAAKNAAVKMAMEKLTSIKMKAPELITAITNAKRDADLQQITIELAKIPENLTTIDWNELNTQLNSPVATAGGGRRKAKAPAKSRSKKSKK